MTETASATAGSLSTVGALTGPNNREDWWAVAIGIGLILVAVALFAAGGSIRWIAIAPQKWSHLSQAAAQLQADAPHFLALFVLVSNTVGVPRWAAAGLRVELFI
jgi:hypothetical protein